MVWLTLNGDGGAGDEGLSAFDLKEFLRPLMNDDIIYLYISQHLKKTKYLSLQILPILLENFFCFFILLHIIFTKKNLKLTYSRCGKNKTKNAIRLDLFFKDEVKQKLRNWGISISFFVPVLANKILQF